MSDNFSEVGKISVKKCCQGKPLICSDTYSVMVASTFDKVTWIMHHE